MRIQAPRSLRPTASSRTRSLIALSAAVILACVGCADEDPGPPAVLVDSVTFESDEVANVSHQVGESDALSVTDAQARAGEASGMALLREGDGQFKGELGYRSEWQSGFRAETGTEYWYGVSFYIPRDWYQGDNDNFFDDRIIFQFHEGTGSSPALSIHLDEKEAPGRFFIRRRAEQGFDYLWSMTFETERWYDFAVNAVWSRNDDDGFIRLFIDQKYVGEYEGETLVDGRIIYTKWGIYGQPTRLFVDEIRIAKGSEGGLEVVSPD